MEEDANAFLMGGGKTPSLSFRNAQVGKTYAGTVDRPSRVLDQRSVDTGEIVYWDEEKTRPKKMVVVYIQTGEIDHTLEDHDGVWAWYVKGKSATDALRAAIRASGRSGLEIGGRVSVTYTGEGVASNKAFNPPKQYMVTYVPPADASAEIMKDEPRQNSRLQTVAAGQASALRGLRGNDEPPF